jgi:methyl-accepting chemotaxis protein
MKIKDLSLKFKLLITTIGGILAISVVSFISFNSLTSDLANYNALLKGDITTSLEVDRLSIDFKEQIQSWKNILIRGDDSATRERYWKKFKAQQAQVQAEGIAILDSQPNGKSRDLIQKFMQQHQQAYQAYTKGYNVFIESDYSIAAADLSVKSVDVELKETLKNAAELLHESSLKQSKNLHSHSEDVIFQATVALIISAILVALFTYVIINKIVVIPINALTTQIKAISKGNLNTNITISSNDELGKISQACSSLQGSLKETTTQLDQSIKVLSTSAENLSRISGQIQSGTQDQYSRTEEVATAMNEMSATAQEVASHANNAAEAANEADTSSQQALVIMNGTISSISAMSDEISNTAEVIKKLEVDTNSVGTVLDVIKGIAEQTNLLALNAAIEAARAGEQGRGFAVVADEVRTLAQRTQESTAQIHGIIESAQSGAQAAVTAINQGQARTQESVEQANQAGNALESITHAVERIRDMNQQIASAAMEQTSASEDITKNVTEITAIANNTAENAEETSVHSNSLQGIASTLNDLLQKLNRA